MQGLELKTCGFWAAVLVASMVGMWAFAVAWFSLDSRLSVSGSALWARLILARLRFVLLLGKFGILLLYFAVANTVLACAKVGLYGERAMYLGLVLAAMVNVTFVNTPIPGTSVALGLLDMRRRWWRVETVHLHDYSARTLLTLLPRRLRPWREPSLLDKFRQVKALGADTVGATTYLLEREIAHAICIKSYLLNAPTLRESIERAVQENVPRAQIHTSEIPLQAAERWLIWHQFSAKADSAHELMISCLPSDKVHEADHK